jgi:transposase
MEQSKGISFKGQNIYVGIDVHLKSWSVTILSETSVLKQMSQGADPDALYRFLTSHYPEAEYYSVYEAGFCGFWIHDRLTELGIHNIVVNPADVPTMSSEKLRKTDAVDSKKLAVSLRAKQLKGIYTPDSEALEIRSLIRLKNSITKDMTRQKNRIKSQLRYLGVEIPVEYLEPHSNWSKRFLNVYSHDIDPHSYDVDPLEEGRAFKEQSLFACKQAA